MIRKEVIHFRPNNSKLSACGVYNPKFTFFDARYTTCKACLKTVKCKTYLGQIKNEC